MATSITADEARHIASLPKDEGRSKLLSHLGWPHLDEETDMRRAIHLDYLYDHLIYTAGRGFPWGKVAVVVSAAQDLLTTCVGKSMLEAIKHYQKLSESLIPSLGERNYKIYTDFVFSTFMAHYRLFQCVFTVPRDEMVPKVSRSIVLPPEPLNLQDGKLQEVWDYDKKYEAVEEEEKHKEEEWNREQERVAQKSSEAKTAALRNVQDIDGPLTKESVAKIIEEVLGASVMFTGEQVRTMIGQTMEGLQYKLDRTLIPRPQAMGPPPRFSPKTPAQPVEVIPPATIDQPPTKPEKEKSRSKSRESNKSGRSNKSKS